MGTLEKVTINNIGNQNLLQELSWKDVAFHVGCERGKAQRIIKNVKKHFNSTQLRINLYQLLVFQGFIKPFETKKDLVN